jgi:hypothetical protein
MSLDLDKIVKCRVDISTALFCPTARFSHLAFINGHRCNKVKWFDVLNAKVSKLGLTHQNSPSASPSAKKLHPAPNAEVPRRHPGQPIP